MGAAVGPYWTEACAADRAVWSDNFHGLLWAVQNILGPRRQVRGRINPAILLD